MNNAFTAKQKDSLASSADAVDDPRKPQTTKSLEHFKATHRNLPVAKLHREKNLKLQTFPLLKICILWTKRLIITYLCVEIPLRFETPVTSIIRSPQRYCYQSVVYTNISVYNEFL